MKHRFLLDCAALAESGNTMSIREERKQQSRQAIMDAVLQLCSAGRAFSSISLREISRQIGLVPTAF